jgi:site-specific recombinase XerC
MSNDLVLFSPTTLPRLIADAGERAGMRFVDFFSANIRNPNTRRAYSRAVADFLLLCERWGVPSIAAIQPAHVATYIEQLTGKHSAPTVKVHLAALRRLFSWLVVGQVIPDNPAADVRGPSHIYSEGKTPVLSPDEARQLLESIDVSTHIGLRDRALIALMIYCFARIGAVIGMKVEDVFVKKRRLWVLLHEKGGKQHQMPCHHNLETYLHEYLDLTGIAADPKRPLFPTIARAGRGRGPGRLSLTPLPQRSAFAMIRRRTAAAGIATLVGNHSFRATGITTYLTNGGTLEKARTMANHASTRTTQLYDRRRDELTLDEVERIVL